MADSQTLQQVKLHFTRIDCYRTEHTRWLGRLEGLSPKHWPELKDWYADFIRVGRATSGKQEHVAGSDLRWKLPYKQPQKTGLYRAKKARSG